jgi:hypothetical protein
MPPKVKCFTKPRIAVADGGKGGNYTACLPAKELDKPEKKKKIKFVVKKPVEEPKKKKIKFVVKKPVEAPPKKKFYVNNPLKATKKSQQPAQQPKIIAPKKKEPMKAKIIAAVKVKQSKVEKMQSKPNILTTPGEKLTGLTSKQMNKLTPEQLFGLLPVDLAKKILDPKTTGVQVGGIPISKITEGDLEIYDLVPENEDANYNESMLYNDDYTDVMSRSQSDWYLKAHHRGYDDLSEKSQEKFEKLEDKIMEGIRRILSKQHTKMFKDWKKANKGMVSNLTNFKKSFERYYESH